jgi:hypothetical protein
MNDLQRYEEVASVRGDQLLVSSTGLFSTFNTLYGSTRINQLTPKAIESSLKMLSGTEHSKLFRSVSPKYKGTITRRWSIPLASLLKRMHQMEMSIDFRKSVGDAAWKQAAMNVLSADELAEMCAMAAPPPPQPSLMSRSSPSGLVSAGMGTAQLFSSPNGHARPS